MTKLFICGLPKEDLSQTIELSMGSMYRPKPQIGYIINGKSRQIILLPELQIKNVCINDLGFANYAATAPTATDPNVQCKHVPFILITLKLCC